MHDANPVLQQSVASHIEAAAVAALVHRSGRRRPGLHTIG